MFYRKTMKKTVFSMASALLVFSTLTLGNATTYAADGTATVNWNVENQEIDGFGVSGAFHQAYQLQQSNSTVQNQVLDLLFSTTNGAGLSIIRNDVGDSGTWNDVASWPHTSIEPTQGNFNTDVLNDDQLWFMNQAKTRGVNRFFSTVWSPPGWMKTNGTVEHGGSLRTDMYQAYADYLARYIKDYKSKFGIDLYAISLANEPNNDTYYSSSDWTGNQFRDFINNNLIATFDNNNITSKVIVGESAGWEESLAVSSLNDGTASSRLDITGTHAYDAGTGALPVTLSKNKKFWQTEVGNMGPNNNTLDDQLYWAKLINSHMLSNASAWLYWWGVTVKNDGEALINNLNPSANTYTVQKRLYAIANFSRFIRPGYVRIGADSNPATDVYLTAYKNKSDGKFVLVAINDSGSNKSINFSLNGFTASSVTPYRTSATESMAALSNVSVTGGNALNVTLNAKSITTFVGTATSTGNSGVQLFFNDFENGTIGQNAAGWTTDGGTWQVFQPAGNTKEYQKTSTGDNTSLAGSSWSNYYVQGYLKLADVTNGGVCLLGRVQDNSHYYQLEFKKDTSGNRKWWIWKNNGGSWTQIASGYYPYEANTYYLTRLDMNGSRLTASISTDFGNSFVTLGSGQDTQYTSGKIGVRSWGSGGSFDAIRVIQDN
ncbi:glycoside hydrolase family 30 protein [Cohnella yongneupensis]|uniref:Glycoside hydrolase n=1 Tax=Cohnella yongneupensis TaxID=425006 RepID=A0ABW0R2H8_9BACL